MSKRGAADDSQEAAQAQGNAILRGLSRAQTPMTSIPPIRSAPPHIPHQIRIERNCGQVVSKRGAANESQEAAQAHAFAILLQASQPKSNSLLHLLPLCARACTWSAGREQTRRC